MNSKKQKMQDKKTANASMNKSKLAFKQGIKKKKGSKKGADIIGVFMHREVLKIPLLEMFYSGDLGVDPQAGLATLERFITDRKIFVSKSGKPLSFHTIKGDFIEILKRNLHKKSNNNKEKK